MLAEEEMTDASCDHLVVERVDNLLRKTALYSYQDLLRLLSTAEDDDSGHFWNCKYIVRVIPFLQNRWLLLN